MAEIAETASGTGRPVRQRGTLYERIAPTASPDGAARRTLLPLAASGGG